MSSHMYVLMRKDSEREKEIKREIKRERETDFWEYCTTLRIYKLMLHNLSL